MKRRNILFALVMVVAGACAAEVDEPATAPSSATVEQSVQGKGEPPKDGDPAALACSSWTNISCSPANGGTAMCRRVLQEQSAWCAAPQPGYAPMCCYP